MARPSLARRLGAATMLTTLVFTAAACGGDTATDDTATDPSSETSSDPTDEATPEAAALTELSAEDFYPAVMEALEGAESMGFSVKTTGGPTASDMTGVMEYTDDGIAMEASTTGDQAMETIMVDNVIYISGGGIPLPDGKKWFKVDMNDPDSLFGQIGKATDPTVLFEAMAAPKKFELLGTEEVDGVETNHYNVVMDTASYTKAMELPAEVAEFMPKEIGVEMWVDADNLPRKFYQELEMPAVGGGQPTNTTTEGAYFDFGTEVDIEAPPASEVADSIPGLS